jgi:hypothetical protein
MSEARFLNVEHRVANLENESVRDGNAIERLKKEDAVLARERHQHFTLAVGKLFRVAIICPTLW